MNKKLSIVLLFSVLITGFANAGYVVHDGDANEIAKYYSNESNIQVAPIGSYSLGGTDDWDGDGSLETLYQDGNDETCEIELDSASTNCLGLVTTNINGIGGIGQINSTYYTPYVDTNGDVGIMDNTGSTTVISNKDTSWTAGDINDFDNDGSNEIAFLTSSNNIRFYENDLSTYSEVSLANSHNIGVDSGDLDGDGYAEVLVTNSDSKLFEVDAQGTTQITPGENIYDPGAIGDWNDDGKIDYSYRDTSGNLKVRQYSNNNKLSSSSIGQYGRQSDIISTSTPNQAPVVDFISTYPETWLTSSTIDVTVNAQDTDGDIDSVNVTMLDGNNNILKTETFTYGSSSSVSETYVDWYTFGSTGDRTLKVTATDNSGATDTNSTTQTVSSSTYNIDNIKPSDSQSFGVNQQVDYSTDVTIDSGGLEREVALMVNGTKVYNSSHPGDGSTVSYSYSDTYSSQDTKEFYWGIYDQSGSLISSSVSRFIDIENKVIFKERDSFNYDFSSSSDMNDYNEVGADLYYQDSCDTTFQGRTQCLRSPGMQEPKGNIYAEYNNSFSIDSGDNRFFNYSMSYEEMDGDTSDWSELLTINDGSNVYEITGVTNYAYYGANWDVNIQQFDNYMIVNASWDRIDLGTYGNKGSVLGTENVERNLSISSNQDFKIGMGVKDTTDQIDAYAGYTRFFMYNWSSSTNQFIPKDGSEFDVNEEVNIQIPVVGYTENPVDIEGIVDGSIENVESITGDGSTNTIAFNKSFSNSGDHTYSFNAITSSPSGSAINQSTSRTLTVQSSNSNANLISPSSNQDFIVADSSEDITFEYDVESFDNQKTTASLVLTDPDGNTNTIETTTVAEGTTQSVTSNENINTNYGSFSWYIELTGQSSGDIQSSSTQTFTMSQEDASITLNNPVDQETYLNGFIFDADVSANTEDQQNAKVEFIRDGTILNTQEITGDGSTNTLTFNHSVDTISYDQNTWINVLGSNDQAIQQSNVITTSIVQPTTFQLNNPKQNGSIEVDNLENKQDTTNYKATSEIGQAGIINVYLKKPSANYSEIYSENISRSQAGNNISIEESVLVENISVDSESEISEDYYWKVNFSGSDTTDSFESTENKYNYVANILGITGKIIQWFKDFNDNIKQEAGATGQFFIATLAILLVSGYTHHVFDNEMVSTASLVLLSLGFSFADGYYPIGVFYILVAVVGLSAAYFGSKVFGGS